MYLHDQVFILLHSRKTPAGPPAYTCFPGRFEFVFGSSKTKYYLA